MEDRNSDYYRDLVIMLCVFPYCKHFSSIHAFSREGNLYELHPPPKHVKKKSSIYSKHDFELKIVPSSHTIPFIAATVTSGNVSSRASNFWVSFENSMRSVTGCSAIHPRSRPREKCFPTPVVTRNFASSYLQERWVDGRRTEEVWKGLTFVKLI